MIGTIFYNLFIMPLELIFEVIFWFLRDYPALAIFAISIVMNFLALPLYRRADAIQEEERDKTASMAYRVGRIKKTFSGDERYMMLTTYYRQQNYKPVYALRSTFPLLLQVPFFIAAYHYLSNLTLLNGVSFLFLNDLGAPDQLIRTGSVSINIMPVLMTLINVVSAYIYLRGFPLKDKIQTYGIAVIFFVLLYNSPSGLVLYWTLNQIFSVLKNVFMKLVKSRKVLNLFFSAAGIIVFLVLILTGIAGSGKRILAAVLILLIFQAPALISLWKRLRAGRNVSDRSYRVSTFLLGCVLITILLGVVIPMSVISSSPTEFMTEATTPASIIINNLCISAGFFIIWLGIYYYMSGQKVRNLFTCAVWILSVVFLADYMLFSKNHGVMSTYLVFDEMPVFTGSEKRINLLVLILLCAGLILLMRFLPKWINGIYAILILGCVVLAGISIYSTAATLRERGEQPDPGVYEDPEIDHDSIRNETDKIIPLSREGKNVIVLMLDRAIGSYLPYIFHEKPELEQQFAGFTYYANTVSFGGHTNFGMPPIFGGYEYTPSGMNAREGLSLGEKHNEALLLMPTLFSEEDYQVTVCDPIYAGYVFYPPDLSIYDGMDHVSAYITYGKYSGALMEQFGSVIQKTQTRNFFFYSLMRAVPVVFQNTVYNNGNYYSTTEISLSCSDEFIYSYSVLYSLVELTQILETDQNTVLLMENDTTHSNTILQTPEYEPVVEVTSDMYADQDRFTLDGKTVLMETEYQIGHYHANMAAYLMLGRWFDFLREQGVYDNTRIILVSDHGNGMGQFEELLVAQDWDAERVNPILLFKDFGETDFKVSDEFMTTADVPLLAMNGLISDMTNPFTGKEIVAEADKENYPITSSRHWNIEEYNGHTFDTSDGSWWKVHGNIYDKNCWERMD